MCLVDVLFFFLCGIDGAFGEKCLVVDRWFQKKSFGIKMNERDEHVLRRALDPTTGVLRPVYHLENSRGMQTN